MRWAAAALCLMVLLSVARVKATEEEDPVLADAIDRATGGDPQTMTQASVNRPSPRRAAPPRATPRPDLPRVPVHRDQGPIGHPPALRLTHLCAMPHPQLLHWGLQHTDLDELHAKAEHLRTTQQLGGEGGGGEGDLTPGVLSASGNVGEAPPGLPSPDGTAAPRTVSPMSKERRVELDELARIMMPDMVAEMRKMLAVAEDETMDPEASHQLHAYAALPSCRRSPVHPACNPVSPGARAGARDAAGASRGH